MQRTTADPNATATSEVSEVGVADQCQFPTEAGPVVRFSIAVLALAAGTYGALLTAAGGGVHAAVPPPVLTVALVLAFAGGVLSTWSPCGYSSLSLLRPWGGYGPGQVLGWIPTFIAHGVGYAVSGALLAGLLGLLGTAFFSTGLTGWPLAAVGLIALGYGLQCLGLVPMPYPERRAQVPHDARNHMPMWRVGLLYGLILGLNFSTYVRTPIVFVAVALAVVSGSFLTAFLLIGALNLGRWLPLAVNAFPVQDRSVQRWLAANEGRAVLVDAGLLAAVGAMFIVYSVV